MTACGGTEAGNGPGVGGSGGGAGGAGGTPSPSDARTFDVGCLRPDVDLSFAVELSVSLDAPFATSGPTEVTFAPTVTMRQETAIALIAANVSSIDITSMSVQARVNGADPSRITSALAEAPIQDLDLTVDTDDDGEPGPHTFSLAVIETSAFVEGNADRIEFVLSTVAFDFGDFRIPSSCTDGLSVVGNPLTFAVSPN